VRAAARLLQPITRAPKAGKITPLKALYVPVCRFTPGTERKTAEDLHEKRIERPGFEGIEAWREPASGRFFFY
ncbi:hypothetical protein, partial [Paenibacillus hubeiensis]|uniref:hypothetical protein n=1 Tax=Paenibacillus hubeiensis TaxID=3077330 RepID=UPI0031BB3EF7